MKQIIYPLTCLLLLISLPGMAQPGSLDLTFSGDGKTTTGFMLPSGTLSDGAYSVAIQRDGKIVVAGYSDDAGNYDFALVRYNANGTLDNTFNLDGKVTTDFAGHGEEAYSIAIQRDGKIVVAGTSYNGANYDFALARYNVDGTLDNTFSGDGKLTTDFGSSNDEAHSVAIQGDGKIVVAGYSYSNSNGEVFKHDFEVARYNINGTLDNTFSGDGKLTTDIAGTFDGASSLAIQVDGKIVAAGESNDSRHYNIAVIRYNADGTLDNTFSGDGKQTTSFGLTADYANSVAVQANGKIVVAGESYKDGSSDFALVRYNSNGSLDNTFSGDGMLTTAIESGNDEAHSVAIQGDGKIVAVGFSASDFAAVRYNVDGSLDNTFSGDGMLTTIIGSSSDAYAVAIQGDSKIVAAGASYSNEGDFAVVRYNNNGTTDNSFASDGKIVTNIGGPDIAATDNSFAVAVKSSNKIVLAGTSSLSGSDSKSDLALVQYNTDGTIDNSFGFQGKVLGEFEGGKFAANAVAIQPDDKIIVGGYFFNTKSYFALVRYNANGSLDATFDQDGIVTTNISGVGTDICHSIVVQPDGKILAAGFTQSCLNGCNTDFALVRYNTNGSLDNTFSGDGMLTTDFSSPTDVINSVALQPDGKIVVVGYTNNGSNNDIAIARYNADGTLDNTFSGDGKLTTGFGRNYDDYGQCVKIQADGKIIAGGYSGKTLVKDNDFVLVRYNTNGTLDNTFNSVGSVITTINGTSADYCTSIILEASGKIIAGGYYINAQGHADFALSRYLSNGKLDNTFGAASIVTTDFAFTDDYGTATAIGGDGKLVMAGYSNNDFAVARYNLAAAPAATFTKAVTASEVTQPSSVEVFPNPFFSKAIITYTVEKDAAVTIDLVDAGGRKIRTAAHERASKGIHRIELNRENLAAGIYFLRIAKDTEVMTKKIIIE